MQSFTTWSGTKRRLPQCVPSTNGKIRHTHTPSTRLCMGPSTPDSHPTDQWVYGARLLAVMGH